MGEMCFSSVAAVTAGSFDLIVEGRKRRGAKVCVWVEKIIMYNDGHDCVYGRTTAGGVWPGAQSKKTEKKKKRGERERDGSAGQEREEEGSSFTP